MAPPKASLKRTKSTDDDDSPNTASINTNRVIPLNVSTIAETEGPSTSSTISRNKKPMSSTLQTELNRPPSVPLVNPRKYVNNIITPVCTKGHDQSKVRIRKAIGSINYYGSPPNHCVVMDSGAYSIKIGYANQTRVNVVPNCIMKAKSERKRTFIGSRIRDCRDLSGLYFQRPCEKGIVTRWGWQKTIWDEVVKPYLNEETVLIATQPVMNFREPQEAMDEIFFEEYYIKAMFRDWPHKFLMENHIYKHNSSTAIVVDQGYSNCYIVPYVNGVVYKSGMLRIDIGGKVLTNHLKEILSYRQLNVMDETYVINQLKEDVCFMSNDFNKDLDIAMKTGSQNTIACTYVLPDFNTKRRGFIPKEDEDLARLAETYQLLQMNNERFTVPEILLRPSIIGFEMMGVPEAIASSINGMPEWTHEDLIKNVIVGGGCAKIPNYKQRVGSDLRTMVNGLYRCELFGSKDPIGWTWKGMAQFAKRADLDKLCITRSDYEECGPAYCYEKMQTPWHVDISRPPNVPKTDNPYIQEKVYYHREPPPPQQSILAYRGGCVFRADDDDAPSAAAPVAGPSGIRPTTSAVAGPSGIRPTTSAPGTTSRSLSMRELRERRDGDVIVITDSDDDTDEMTGDGGAAAAAAAGSGDAKRAHIQQTTAASAKPPQDILDEPSTLCRPETNAVAYSTLMRGKNLETALGNMETKRRSSAALQGPQNTTLGKKGPVQLLSVIELPPWKNQQQSDLNVQAILNDTPLPQSQVQQERCKKRVKHRNTPRTNIAPCNYDDSDASDWSPAATPIRRNKRKCESIASSSTCTVTNSNQTISNSPSTPQGAVRWNDPRKKIARSSGASATVSKLPATIGRVGRLNLTRKIIGTSNPSIVTISSRPTTTPEANKPAASAAIDIPVQAHYQLGISRVCAAAPPARVEIIAKPLDSSGALRQYERENSQMQILLAGQYESEDSQVQNVLVEQPKCEDSQVQSILPEQYESEDSQLKSVPVEQSKREDSQVQSVLVEQSKHENSQVQSDLPEQYESEDSQVQRVLVEQPKCEDLQVQSIQTEQYESDNSHVQSVLVEQPKRDDLQVQSILAEQNSQVQSVLVKQYESEDSQVQSALVEQSKREVSQVQIVPLEQCKRENSQVQSVLAERYESEDSQLQSVPFEQSVHEDSQVQSIIDDLSAHFTAEEDFWPMLFQLVEQYEREDSQVQSVLAEKYEIEDSQVQSLLFEHSKREDSQVQSVLVEQPGSEDTQVQSVLFEESKREDSQVQNVVDKQSGSEDSQVQSILDKQSEGEYWQVQIVTSYSDDSDFRPMKDDVVEQSKREDIQVQSVLFEQSKREDSQVQNVVDKQSGSEDSQVQNILDKQSGSEDSQVQSTLYEPSESEDWQVQIVTSDSDDSHKLQIVTSDSDDSHKLQIVTSDSDDSHKLQIVTSDSDDSHKLQIVTSDSDDSDFRPMLDDLVGQSKREDTQVQSVLDKQSGSEDSQVLNVLDEQSESEDSQVQITLDEQSESEDWQVQIVTSDSDNSQVQIVTSDSEDSDLHIVISDSDDSDVQFVC